MTHKLIASILSDIMTNQSENTWDPWVQYMHLSGSLDYGLS